MTEIVGYDSFGAPLLAHQLKLHRCPTCSSEYPSQSAAEWCCDREYERGYD